MSSARPVVMAAVAGAHGVTGEVRLKLFASSADSLKRHRRFDAGGRPLTLSAIRPGPQGAVARFTEISDRTAAEALRGTLLTVPRADLPELPPGEYYWHDLIGLPVHTPDGAAAGEVIGVENFGASDLLEIRRPEGGTVLVPLIPDAIAEIADHITIAPEWLA